MASPEDRQLRDQILEAVGNLRQDTWGEDTLGDDGKSSGNFAVSSAAEALSELVLHHRDAVGLAIAAETLEAAVHALRLRPNSEAVVKQACRLLGCLAAASSGDEKRRAQDVVYVDAVVVAMTSHPNSLAVQECAVEALGCLVDGNPKMRRCAKENGGIRAVVLALEVHVEKVEFQKIGATALASLVNSDSICQDAAVKDGALAALASSLQRNSVIEVLESLLHALCNLVMGSITHQRTARDAGTLGAIIALLKRYHNYPTLQARGFSALGSLVAGNAQSQDYAREAGGIEVVANALRDSSSEEQLLEDAADALAHLVAKNTRNQVHAQKLGVLQNLIQIAWTQTGEGVKARAVHALGCLVASNATNQQLAGEAGAIQAAMSTIRKFPENELVQESALVALGELSANNRDNQVVARESGALMASLTMLWHPTANTRIQFSALNALTEFVASSHENTMAAVEVGAIEEVFNALKLRAGVEMEDSNGDESPTSPSSPSRVASDSPHAGEVRKLARESGLIHAAIDALQKAPKRAEDGVYRKAAAASRSRILTILGDLVEGDPENQLTAGALGLISEVVSVLRREKKSEETHLQALRALTCLMSNCAENQRLAKEALAGETLQDLQRQYRANAVVCDRIALAEATLFSGQNFTKHMTRIFQAEVGKQKHVEIKDVAMRGITLKQIRDLVAFIKDALKRYDIADVSTESPTAGQSLVWEEANLYQVKDNFILPLTQENRCSYVESVSPGPQSPMWMVSHWWGTPLAHTFRMLQLQGRSRSLHNTDGVTYWCCTFANNQHTLCELEETDVLKSPFARAMFSKECMGTVLLCDPAVTPLRRIWCVFEAHITQKLRFGMLASRADKQFFLDIVAPSSCVGPSKEVVETITMTMLQDATGGSWQEISERSDVYFPLHVAEIGVKADLCKASASVEADRLAILNFVANGAASHAPPPPTHPNYDKLNLFVRRVFASAELYRLAVEQPEGCLEAIDELLKMGADVNSFVREGNTALLAAAGADTSGSRRLTRSRTVQHKLISSLLEARADVNSANSHQQTIMDCSGNLHEETRQLLRESGAVTYAEAVPELQRKLNTQLSHLLSAGFGSEWQAFLGGSAGTRLNGPAQRSLQAVAGNVLKRYPWASCRIGIQTNASKHQSALAHQRGSSVKFELESAQCQNDFEVRCCPQSSLLCLTIDLVSATRNSSCRSPGKSVGIDGEHEEAALDADEICSPTSVNSAGITKQNAFARRRTATLGSLPIGARATDPYATRIVRAATDINGSLLLSRGISRESILTNATSPSAHSARTSGPPDGYDGLVHSISTGSLAQSPPRGARRRRSPLGESRQIFGQGVACQSTSTSSLPEEGREVVQPTVTSAGKRRIGAPIKSFSIADLNISF